MISYRIQRREQDLPLQDCFVELAMSLPNRAGLESQLTLPFIIHHRGRRVVGGRLKEGISKIDAIGASQHLNLEVCPEIL